MLHRTVAITIARESRQRAPFYFDYNEYRIREDQISTLYNNAEKLKARPDVELIIEGHCDARGSDESNVA